MNGRQIFDSQGNYLKISPEGYLYFVAIDPTCSGQIAYLSGEIDALSAQVIANDADIVYLSGQIDAGGGGGGTATSGQITYLSGVIDENTAAIVLNGADIDYLSGAIDTNIINIGINSAAIVLNDADIGYLSGAIDTNTSDISSNSAAIVLNDADIDYVSGVVGQAEGGLLNFFNGTFKEAFNALVTATPTVITLSLEQAGGGDLTMEFSDGFSTLSCAPCTIELTAGTSTVPQGNYIYVPQSTKTLTKSTTAWPSTEHIKIGYFYVQDAPYVQADGALVNQNWNDGDMGTNSQGHLSHIGQWIRSQGAAWFSGVAGNGTSNYITVSAGSPDNVIFKSTAGVISQMHQHNYGAKDMSPGGNDLHVINDSASPYLAVTDINTLLTDSTGATMSGRYFNIVFAGVANKSGEYSPLLCLLPSGSYSSEADAIIDVDKYSTYALPREFTKESGTGFLICAVTFKHSPAGGGTWTISNTTDLRGTTGVTAGGGSGGGGGVTTFTGLTDTPVSYAGTGEYFVKVNAAEDALEFIAKDTSVTDYLSAVVDINTADIALNDTDIAYVSGEIDTTNTAVGLNTTHRTSDGTDHADVVTNTANITLNDADINYLSGQIVTVDTTKYDSTYTTVNANSGTWDASSSQGVYELAFISSDLAAGILTVTHNLGVQRMPFVIVDNSGDAIIPDDVTFTDTNNLDVDLSSYTVTGTWYAVINAGSVEASVSASFVDVDNEINYLSGEIAGNTSNIADLTTDVVTLSSNQIILSGDVEVNTAKVSFPEAPNDGSEYVRKNLAWSVASGGTDYSADIDYLSGQIDLKADDDSVVHDTGNETVAGVKTFSSFPVTPSSAPTTNYQAANKKYVDDNSGSTALSGVYSVQTASSAAIGASWTNLGVGYSITVPSTGAYRLTASISAGITGWTKVRFFDGSNIVGDTVVLQNFGASVSVGYCLEAFADLTASDTITVQMYVGSGSGSAQYDATSHGGHQVGFMAIEEVGFEI